MRGKTEAKIKQKNQVLLCETMTTGDADCEGLRDFERISPTAWVNG